MGIKTIIRKCLPIVHRWPFWMLRWAVNHSYKRALGKKLNLDNVKTFNEKMQWYILYYENPEVSLISDKRQFKSWVAEKLQSDDYTAKVYGYWFNVEDLIRDWEALPCEFVLKSNMSYNGNNIKFIKSKSEYDIQAMLKELKSWLDPRNTCLNAYTCRFNNNIPCIIAEEFLKQDGHAPDDYKIYCFDGNPYCAYVATNHFVNNDYAISLYDMNWKRIDVKYGKYLPIEVERPKHFDEMIEVAQKLSKGFPFVRVDFFEVNNRIYLSELTFDSGWGHNKFNPDSFDLELGNQFVIDTH